MAGFKTIEGMDFAGKRVLLRADLNVPVQDGKVTDATRIERVVPTIREIVKHGGKLLATLDGPRRDVLASRDYLVEKFGDPEPGWLVPATVG